ncbi:hypothetical protein B1218_35560 [Pseudomonas ogarae]|nr:hypothetical protein B1218_35560 [Pseudomonas ogarae]
MRWLKPRGALRAAMADTGRREAERVQCARGRSAARCGGRESGGAEGAGVKMEGGGGRGGGAGEGVSGAVSVGIGGGSVNLGGGSSRERAVELLS